MQRISIVGVVLFIVILLQPTLISATTTTPTPAPSKTPTPSITETFVTPTLTATPDEVIEPFNQADLNVLSGNVQRPNGIIWHNDMLYTSCNGDWTLYEIESNIGSTETYVYGIRNSHTLYAEDNPTNARVDLWMPDFDQNALMYVNVSGSPRVIAPNLEGPWGIAYMDEEHFLVTNLTGNNVSLVSRAGEVTVLLDQMRAPTGIVMDEDTGITYIANNGSARRSIEWISTEDLLEEETPSPQPLVSGLQNTTGMVLAEDGMLYFAYALGTRGVIGRVNPEDCMEAGCSNDEVEIVLYTELAAPLAGLTISPDMRLFVHTIFRPEIYWLQL